MTTIGDRIKARRQALGWTLDRLASEAKVSKGFLSELESGNRKSAGSEYLKQVAGSLGVSLDHLITGAEQLTVDQDVKIPATLAAFARGENLSFQKTLMILKLRQQIVAFRSDGGEDDFDWKPFYETVKNFLQ